MTDHETPDYRPWPRRPDEVQKLLWEAERSTLRRKRRLSDTTRRFKDCIYEEEELRTANFSRHEEAIFTLHSLRLAHNQLNEACNKVWTTAEFLFATSPSARRSGRLLVPAFSSTFSLGTLIPTLYYATISSMLAVMTSMGCIFFRDDFGSGRRSDRDLCCIRTKAGWFVRKRTTYASSVLRVGVGDWHQMVVNYYSFFVRENYQVPRVTVTEMMNFRRERDDTHYRVLSETNVSKTADLGLYFERLMLTTRFLGDAIEHVGAIQRERKGYTDRYAELVGSYRRLFREYSEKFSLEDLVSQLPVEANQRN